MRFFSLSLFQNVTLINVNFEMDYNTTKEIIIMPLSWDIRAALGHQKVINTVYCFSIEKCSLNAPLRYMLENINVTCLAYLCYVSSCFNKLHWFHYVLILVKVKALLFCSKTSLSVKTSNLVKMSTNYV